MKEKYPIKYKTSYIDENSNDILKIILEGFDSWNKGISYYIDFVEKNYHENATSSSLDERKRTMEQYKNEIKELFDKEFIEKLYFDNILIRENWALHYRYRKEDKSNKEKSVGDRM